MLEEGALQGVLHKSVITQERSSKQLEAEAGNKSIERNFGPVTAMGLRVYLGGCSTGDHAAGQDEGARGRAGGVTGRAGGRQGAGGGARRGGQGSQGGERPGRGGDAEVSGWRSWRTEWLNHERGAGSGRNVS